MKKFITLNKYGELYIDKILFETYFPIIFTCKNENNDIFIHMDKKSKNYDEESIEKMAKKSIIYHTERSNVAWGGIVS